MVSGFSGLYRFGNFRLETSSRRLTCSDRPVTLAPKTFDLLVLLVESGGRLLSKEEMLAALWSGAFVEEANLSFQISALRKALGADADWIQTVPKHGYRFLAEVTKGDPPSTPAGPDSRETAEARKASPGFRRFLWVGAGVLVFASGALMVWLLMPDRKTGAVRNLVANPLTSYPGTEQQPSFSPDGSQVAFSWNGPDQTNFDIYVKLVGLGEPFRLTNDPAEDEAPAWSPDGRWIAFLRREPSRAQTDSEVFLVPALGGAARKVCDCPTFKSYFGHGFLAWTPDGKWIAAACRMPEGQVPELWLVPLESGDRKRLTTVPAGSGGDVGPAFSSDGRHLAFVRTGNSEFHGIYVLALTSGYQPLGTPRRLAVENSGAGSPSWAPDGKSIFYSAGGYMGIRQLNHLALTGNADASKPKILAAGEGATAVSVSRSGKIVYAREFRDTNIWRFDLSASPGLSNPVRLIASTFDERHPDFSPDGNRIAFASTRSGSDEIWISDRDGLNPIQITSMSGPMTANPHWSPDGQSIVFDSRKYGSSDLWMLEVKSGNIRRITDLPGHEIRARWSRDGKWLYYAGMKGLWKVPAAGGTSVMLTRNGGITGNESADGRWVYYSKDWERPTSIWKMPAGGGDAEKVLDGLTHCYNFAVAEKGIYLLSLEGSVQFLSLTRNSRVLVEYFDFATGKRTRLHSIYKPFWFGVALSPDERWFIYSQLDQEGSDLMLVEERTP